MSRLPGASGARDMAPEVERQKLKFLQLNLGRGKEAQNLLMQTARERSGPKTLLGIRMHQGGLGSLFAALI